MVLYYIVRIYALYLCTFGTIDLFRSDRHCDTLVTLREHLVTVREPDWVRAGPEWVR